MPKLYADTKGFPQPKNLREQLIQFEGCVPYAYTDSMPEKYLTIGVGRCIDKRKGGGLSDDEIDYLLDNDIRRIGLAVLEALPWALHLNEPRQAVLVGMAFQLGLAGLLRFKGTLADVRDGYYGAAAIGMRRSLWAKQTPARVAVLAEQMASGAWPS